MKTFYNCNNKPFVEIVYGNECNQYYAYCVGQYLDNLHLDFLKQHKFIPKESITCCNSKDLYKII